MKRIGRIAIPNDVLDRILALERRLDDLEGMAAMATVDPETGGDTYISILNEIEEGPDVDIPDGKTIGRGGDTILLYDSGGDPVAEYDADDSGLTSALAAAASGDVVTLPAIAITGGPWTVPSGVLLRGLGREASGSKLTGDLTLTGYLRGVHVVGDIDIYGGVIQCLLEGTYTLYEAAGILWSKIICTSGNGIVFDDGVTGEGRAVSHCVIELKGCTYGVYASSITKFGVLSHCLIRPHKDADGTEKGVYVDEADFEIYNSFIQAGDDAGTIANAGNISNTTFLSENEDGLVHTSGANGHFKNCNFLTRGGAGKYGLNLGATITLYDCGWNSINDRSYITYGQGSRGNYSVEDYHASDIEDDALTRHTPLSKYDATTAPTTGDDSGDGYGVGSRWYDVTNDKAYVCLDASVGAADWLELGSGSGGTDLTGLGTDNTIARWNGTDTLQDSGHTIDDNDTLTFPDSATHPPWNVTERNSAPSSPSAGDIYLDDGTNTSSGNPGWRRYTGSAWEDVSAAASGSHASTHIDGGADAIDGDKLEITWTPTTYSRDGTNPSETDSDDDLTAHLKGIDDEFASIVAGTGYTEGARVRHSSDQSISDSTLTALSFNTEDYDTDTIHDTVTNNERLTCQTAGKYIIVGGVSFANDGTDTGFRLVRIRLNGTDDLAMARITQPSEQTLPEQTVSTIYDLSVSDYVELVVYQNSGGALNVRADSKETPVLAMQRIG